MSIVLALWTALSSLTKRACALLALIPKQSWDHIFAFVTATLVGWMLAYIHYDVTGLQARAAEGADLRVRFEKILGATANAEMSTTKTAATADSRSDKAIAARARASQILLKEVQRETPSVQCVRSPIMGRYLDGLRNAAAHS